MATPVIMPRQGQSVESCLFTQWHVPRGGKVRQGDILFSYETDKAAFDAEAPADGILLETFASPGDVIPVLQHIAVIGEPGEDITGLAPAAGSSDAASESNRLVREETGNPVTGITGDEIVPENKNRLSPRARKAARKLKVNPEGLKGTGPEGRIIEKDIRKKAGELPKSSPLARSISYEDRLAIPAEGSGPGGKVMKTDLPRPGARKEDFEDKPVSNIRKIIARNMLASLQQTAKLTLHSGADARKLQETRKALKSKTGLADPINITINDLVCFAVIRALLKHPEMNSHFLGDTIRSFHHVHLGMAVDAPRGLIVPTLRNADRMEITELSARLKDLASGAQQGNIDPDLLTGATFTVTNLGALGVESFTPVLNPPQVGILGVNTIRYEPDDVGNGIIGFIPKIGLSLTFDHRAIDGAPAALFLKEVAGEIAGLQVEIP